MNRGRINKTQALRMWGHLKASFFVLAFFCVLGSHEVLASENEEDDAPWVETYLSLGDEHGFPLPQAKEIFDCADQIYSVVKVHNYAEGKYALAIDWIDPNQRQRERTEYPFSTQDPALQPTTRLWSWLRLKRGAGAGLFQWINPSAGLEDLIGIWTLKVTIDGEHVASQEFEVSC